MFDAVRKPYDHVVSSIHLVLVLNAAHLGYVVPPLTFRSLLNRNGSYPADKPLIVIWPLPAVEDCMFLSQTSQIQCLIGSAVSHDELRVSREVISTE